MSHSQFHCTGRVYLDLHGLIFETSICYWQDQPGSSYSHLRPSAGTATVVARGETPAAAPPAQAGRSGGEPGFCAADSCGGGHRPGGLRARTAAAAATPLGVARGSLRKGSSGGAGSTVAAGAPPSLRSVRVRRSGSGPSGGGGGLRRRPYRLTDRWDRRGDSVLASSDLSGRSCARISAGTLRRSRGEEPFPVTGCCVEPAGRRNRPPERWQSQPAGALRWRVTYAARSGWVCRWKTL